MLIVIGVSLIVGLFAPLIFGMTVEKDITIVYSDTKGIIDSCNNFYPANNMDDKTITEINRLVKDDIKPIRVKIFKPNRGLAPFLPGCYNDAIKEVIGGSGIKSNNCN